MSDLLSSIAAKRDERVQDLHLDLPVPTWDGDLVARFEILPRKKVEEFARKKASLETNMDFIIQAVRELYARDVERNFPGTRMEENEDYVRLEDEAGLPIKFDARFADKVGQPDLKDARSVLMYAVKDNVIALGGLAQKLNVWMSNTDSKVADDLVGES